MNILDKITFDKRNEVALRKQLIPISQLEQSVLFERATVSLAENLRNSKSGIIAEVKNKQKKIIGINKNHNKDRSPNFRYNRNHQSAEIMIEGMEMRSEASST